MIRLTYHIPTESFGFVEMQYEIENKTGKDMDVELMPYEEAKALYVPPVVPPVVPKTAPRSDVELLNKEFNVKLDKYLAKNVLGSHEYESCTPLQKIVLQCIKRSIKRMELEGRKATKEEIEEAGEENY